MGEWRRICKLLKSSGKIQMDKHMENQVETRPMGIHSVYGFLACCYYRE